MDEGPDSFCPNCLLALGIEEETRVEAVALDVTELRVLGTRAPVAPGERIGHYRLLEVIGEGGFGTVWMADQEEPVRRRVALKILKLGLDTKDVLARFEAERQALALMDHPNIARVYDGGATGTGRPFFVMELVRGVPITEYCDARRLTTRERINLFVAVCYAVQHAHQKGIVHRDLKPSNLLVTEQDGDPVPKVLDFGVAKATATPLTEKTLFTRFNQFVGTPLYMSPEQAGLGGLDVDSRSDVYSLGVLLYELLTGQAPLNSRELAAEGLEAMLGAVRQEEAPKPSTRVSTLGREELTQAAARRNEPAELFRKSLRGELDWLVLKALEKDRNRRYQTANALADDLLNYLSGDPITAAPPTFAYQLSKFAAKHRAALGVATGFVLVLLAGVIATTWQALVATRLRRAAEASRDQQRVSLYASEMAVAFRSWELGEAERTRQILERQKPAAGQRDLRGWEWRYLYSESRPREDAIFPNQPGYVAALAYSADGSRLAVGSGGNGNLRIWDAEKRTVLHERDLGRVVIDRVAFTPDGLGLYATLRSTNFVLLDAHTLEERAWFSGHTRRVSGLALDRSGRNLVSAAGDLYGQAGKAEMFLWDTAAQKIEFRFPETTNAALDPRFSPSGRYLSRASDQPGSIEVWDVAARIKLAETKICERGVYMASFSPDESLLASGGADGFIRIWDWRKGEQLVVLGPHATSVRQVEFSPDGTRLVSCALDSTVRMWDIAGRREQVRLQGHRGRVHGVTFSPDGRWVVSRGGPDQSLRFWSAAEREAETLLDRDVESLASCRFVPSGNEFCLLRTSEDSSTLKVWRTASFSRTLPVSPVRRASSSQPALFTVCGKRIAVVVAGEQEVSLQDTVTGHEQSRLVSPVPLLGSLAASRDGLWLAAACAPNYIVVWEVAANRTAAVFQMPEGAEFSAVAGSASLLFSADASRLWIAHPNWLDITSCDWRSPKNPVQLRGHTRGVTSLALSADGTLLASGSTDMTALLWDAATGAPRGVLAGENGGVLALAFSPDDRTLAMGCFDGQVKLWNVPAGMEVATIHSHISTVYSVASSADGRTLASASYDGTSRIWQVPDLAEENAVR